MASSGAIRGRGCGATALAATLRDPSDASGDLRQLLDSFDCELCEGTGFQLETDGSFKAGARGQRLRCDAGPWSWVTSHVFRKTVATRLDEAGFTPRQVADQLGHANPSMTLDVCTSAVTSSVQLRQGCWIAEK